MHAEQVLLFSFHLFTVPHALPALLTLLFICPRAAKKREEREWAFTHGAPERSSLTWRCRSSAQSRLRLAAFSRRSMNGLPAHSLHVTDDCSPSSAGRRCDSTVASPGLADTAMRRGALVWERLKIEWTRGWPSGVSPRSHGVHGAVTTFPPSLRSLSFPRF